MDKQSVLIMLAARLDEYGIDEDEIVKNIKMYDKYLTSLTPEELKTELNNIDIDVVAENIFILIQKKSEKRINANLPVLSVNDDDVQQDDSENGDTKIINKIPAERRDSESQPKNKNIIPNVYKYEQAEKTPHKPTINIDLLDELPDYEAPVKGSMMFWLIFILTTPITIPVFISIISVFIGVIISMVLLIISLVIVMVGIIISGSALSLIGIIYGITQTIVELPSGLYEIGLGILIGGTAMLSGVSVYNIAVRFLPFAIKYVIKFLFFTVNKIKFLFNYLKKESVKR